MGLKTFAIVSTDPVTGVKTVSGITTLHGDLIVDVTNVNPQPNVGDTTADGGSTWVAPAAVTSETLQAQRVAGLDPSGGLLP